MSRTAIFSLAARRHELGGATKGQIYLSKVAIGGVIAALLWLVSLGSFSTILIASAAVFVTSKACYYLNTGDWPSHWDAVADWVCDAALHFAWLAGWWTWEGNYQGVAWLAAAWAVSYPWSCE